VGTVKCKNKHSTSCGDLCLRSTSGIILVGRAISASTGEDAFEATQSQNHNGYYY
jgi:hypothetical protein